MKAPCKGCLDREYLCHSTCIKYNDFKKWKDNISTKIREENDLNHLAVESISRLYSKIGKHPTKFKIGKRRNYE